MPKYRVRSASIIHGTCLLSVDVEELDDSHGPYLVMSDDSQRRLKIDLTRVVHHPVDRPVLAVEPPTFDVKELVGKLLIQSDG